MRRQQIRKGGRWIHNRSQRSAIVSFIVYPHTVEYKYERPTRVKDPWHGYMTTEPYTRRTRVSYRHFITNFERAREVP